MADRSDPGETVQGLPAFDGDLVGRAGSLAAATALANEPGIVTLIGAGGVGKTRLAIELAAHLAPRFDGAMFVALQAVVDVTQVIPVVMRTGGWPLPDDRPPTRALADRVGAGRYLLILDNLEQIADVAPVLAEVIAASPELTIIATSRIPLRTAGERTVGLEPLTTAAGSDSATLLTQFARRSDPAFAVTPENADAVTAICAAAEGLPLAIELAAARLRLVGPVELATLLDQRLKVFRRRASGVPRHDSLAATIDWSYRLLAPDDQRRFTRLGVFAGGFDLGAAAAVTGDDVYDTLDSLDTLVDHGLVRTVGGTDDSGRRFDLLETLREFATARLGESHGNEVAARSAHADWCLALAEELAPHLIGPDAAGALDRIDSEYPNLRAAMGWLLASGGDPEDERILQLTAALHWYWRMRGMVAEGRGWLRRAIEHAEWFDDAALAAALDHSGHLAQVDGDGSTARRQLERSASIRTALGDAVEAARTTTNLAVALTDIGEPDVAEALQLASIATLRATGDDHGVGMAHGGLALITYLRGDVDATASHFERAVAAFERAGDRFQTALTIGHLGTTRTAQGRPEAAVAAHTRAIELARELRQVLTIERNLTNLASALTELGRFEEAEAALDEALAMVGDATTTNRAMATCNRGRLELARGRHATAGRWLADALDQFGRLDLLAGWVVVLELLGILATRSGHPTEALGFLAAADRTRHDAGSTPVGADANAIRTCRALAEAGLPTSDAESALAEGRTWSRGDAIAEAHHLAAALEPSEREAITAPDPLTGLGLTPREAEIARMLIARMTDREIAERLFIGIRTVGTHVGAILRKLGVSSRRDVADRLATAGF